MHVVLKGKACAAPNFQKVVAPATGKALVVFTQPTCPHCAALKESLKKGLDKKTKLVEIPLTMDPTQTHCNGLADKFHINATPTLIPYCNGKPACNPILQKATETHAGPDQPHKQNSGSRQFHANKD